MASTHFSHALSVESPEDARELAALLGEAAANGRAVAPIGGGTKLGFGNPLAREVAYVSTKRLDRVLFYEPADMTLSVEAGATIGSIWNVLNEHGQTIPIDVPDPDSETIGGLIATGLCGPRRLGSGSLRDALIGIQVAYPDGTLGNAGGMVVKNVSGFDLMRMHLGAIGTLGVVTSANFKVVPAARGEATVNVRRESLDQLEADRQAVFGGRIRPIAFEAMRTDDSWIEYLRIEGRPATVEQMARELADRLGDAVVMPLDESRAFWQTYAGQEALSANGFVLQVRGMPSDVYRNARTAHGAFSSAGAVHEDARISTGLGTIRLSFEVPEDRFETTCAAIQQLRASGLGVLVLTAPDGILKRVDAFGTSEQSLELMRQLKRQFDPWSALNPGRVIPEL